MKACEFFIEGSDKPLSYDEMRLYLLNNPEFWKAKKSKDAVQKQEAVGVDAGQQARDGEKVEGGTPQAEPKKTAGKGKKPLNQEERAKKREIARWNLIPKAIKELNRIINEEGINTPAAHLALYFGLGGKITKATAAKYIKVYQEGRRAAMMSSSEKKAKLQREGQNRLLGDKEDNQTMHADKLTRYILSLTKPGIDWDKISAEQEQDLLSDIENELGNMLNMGYKGIIEYAQSLIEDLETFNALSPEELAMGFRNREEADAFNQEFNQLVEDYTQAIMAVSDKPYNEAYSEALEQAYEVMNRPEMDYSPEEQEYYSYMNELRELNKEPENAEELIREYEELQRKNEERQAEEEQADEPDVRADVRRGAKEEKGEALVEAEKALEKEKKRAENLKAEYEAEKKRLGKAMGGNQVDIFGNLKGAQDAPMLAGLGLDFADPAQAKAILEAKQKEIDDQKKRVEKAEKDLKIAEKQDKERVKQKDIFDERQAQKAEKQNVGDISIVPHPGGKSFVVKGEGTKAVKDKLKEVGGSWNRTLGGWSFPNSKLDTVKRILLDSQIEADKQALRDYFKGFQNMGIISDPYQQAKADIAALKVLIRLIKNGTIRTLSDLEQYLKERNKGMNDAMRRIYKAAQHFMDDDNENPTEDMLAEYYDASNPKPEPQPKPEPESDDDDFDATRFGPTGKKKERGFIKNLPQGVKDSITKIEDKHGRDILLYDTYPDEKLIADAKAIWAELNNPDAVAVLISRDNSVHPAVKMALSIMYASHLNQLAEQETDPSRKDKYIEQRDEVLAYIGTRGTDFGQATSFLRFLELMPASTASASMRQIAHSIVMKRWEKARNRIVDVVAEYDTAVKNARREAVTSKPVEAAMEVAFNQMQGNSRRASEGNEKAIAKTRAEAISKVRNKAIEKLEKLKADVSGKMYSGGVFLLVWNAGIDAAIVAVKGGASFAQAVNKAMEAANKAAINTLSPEEAKTFTDKQSDDFRAKIEEMLSDVKQAEIDEAKNIDNLTEKEKEAFVKRTLSDLRVQVRKVVQEHNPNNLIGKTLAEQLHSDIDGLTQEQANSIARAIDDYVNKKVEDAKKKAVEAIINKLAKARVDGTPLTKEEREAISAKLLDLIKKGYPVDKAVKNALGEVIGTELPADFDTKVTDYRKAIDDAKTEGERTQALQDMADYVANSTGGDTVMQYLEDVWFGSMLSGFSTSARNAFGLVYNTVTKQFPAFFYLLYNTKDFKLAAQGLVGFIQGVANNLEHAKDVIVSGKQYDRGFGVEPRRLIERKSFKEVMDMMPVSGDVEAWKKVGNAVLRVATAGTYPVAKYMPRLLTATDVLFFGAGRESALYTDAVIAAYQAVKERKGGGKVTSKEVMQYAQENYLFNDQPNMARFLAKAQKDLAAQGKTVGKVKMKQLQREYMQAFRERMGDAGMLADASRQGAMLTYNYVPEGTLGLLSRWLNRWRAKIPLLKYIIPFVNIPINVLNQQIDATPWGLVRGIMGETSVIGGLGKKANAGSPFAKYSKEMAGYERYEVLAKGMMGTALIMALMMFDNGEDEEQTMEITAGGTYDYNKNREIPGYMEYSVKINGTRISYKDWPIAPILAFYGGLMDYKRYGAKEGENVAMLVLSRLAKYINDGTWWGNMVGLVGLINPAVVTTKGRSIPQELTESTIRKVMTLTPVGSGLWQQGMRQFYEMVEEPKRGNLSRSKDYGGLEAGLKNSLMRVGTTIPVIRDKYGVVYNSLGMPITEKQAVLPFETMEEDTSVVGRLYKAFTEAGVSVGVPKVPEVGIVNYNTMESRPMNDTEYELYKKLSADYTREGLVPHVELIEAFGEVYKLRKKLDRVEDGIPVFKDEESRAKYAEMEKKLFDLDYEITPDMIKENYVGKVLKGVKADARKRAHFRVSMNRNPDSAEAAGFDSEDFAIDEIELLRKRR